MERLEGSGKVVAFQDDVYVLAKPKHFDAIILNAAWQFIQVGLELKRSKTECWASFNEPNSVEAEALGHQNQWCSSRHSRQGSQVKPKA